MCLILPRRFMVRMGDEPYVWDFDVDEGKVPVFLSVLVDNGIPFSVRKAQALHQRIEKDPVQT